MLPVSLTPQDVCDRLDEYVVGQPDAKRAIAIALRNRWRRMRVESEMRDEIIPKNILMIGPTGCGKTEIARRLAKLANAPFVKVEATKFTEVGFHGRDVDTIVRDLVEASATLVKELRTKRVASQVERRVERKLLKALLGPEVASGGGSAVERAKWEAMLREGLLEDRSVELRLPADESPGLDISLPGGESYRMDAAALGLLDRLSGGDGDSQRTSLRRMSVRAARSALSKLETDKLVRSDDVKKEAVRLAEQHGIVVIDEIDKIVPGATGQRSRGDASDEGVQRDLLPLIEGTTVDVRKYGPVKTDHVLFVCSGAFHSSKPSDMLAELQGRLPIRVELKGLTAEDLYRILTEPRANLLEQQKALMKAEGVTLEIDDDAIREMANRAAEINKSVENIGARRLYTVIERVMDDLSFEAAAMSEGTVVRLTKALVEEKLDALSKRGDLKKFII